MAAEIRLRLDIYDLAMKSRGWLTQAEQARQLTRHSGLTVSEATISRTVRMLEPPSYNLVKALGLLFPHLIFDENPACRLFEFFDAAPTGEPEDGAERAA